MSIETEKDKAASPKASWQAQVAFVLSIYSSLFGAFQWWFGQRTDKIKLTMDISQKFLDDKESYHRGIVFLAWENSQEPWYKGQSEEDKNLQDRWNYIYYLEYIAKLINSDEIDFRYLPKPLLCRLYAAIISNRRLHQEGRLPPQFLEIEKAHSIFPDDDACRF